MGSRHIRGPLCYNTHKVVTSGDYVVVNESLVLVNKTVGAATQVTLPPSVSADGRREVIVVDAKGDAATNNITVVPAGSDTVNGGSSYVVGENYGKARFLDAGGGHWVLSSTPEVSSTEIGYLNGVTAGTVTASKAVVVDANKAVDTLVIADSGLKLGSGSGTAVDATALELNRAADVSTRIVNATGSTLVVTEALHDGRLIVLDRAAGIAVTLPAAAAGLKFRFIVKTTFTGAASIKSVTGADIMIGHALMGNDSDNTVVDWQSVAGSTNDTIDLFGTSNSTGGMAGQEVEILGLAANLWFVSIRGDAAGTEASPFANTVT